MMFPTEDEERQYRISFLDRQDSIKARGLLLDVLIAWHRQQTLPVDLREVIELFLKESK